MDDPEELDTRFSKFEPGMRSNLLGEDEDGELLKEQDTPKPAVKADEMLSMFHQRVSRLQKADTPERLAREIPNLNLSRVFCFQDMASLFRLSTQLGGNFKGDSALYKALDKKGYLLKLTKEATPIDAFNKVCNIASEYGRSLDLALAGEAYFAEHATPLIREKALQRLSEI